MAETIKGINVVIGAETTGLAKALEDVNKKSKNIQTELKQVERLLKLDPKNTELLAQKQKLLSDAVANTREKLNSLKTAQEQVNQQFAKGEISEGQYRAFQRELAKTEQDLKKFESQLKSMDPVIESFGDKIQKAGDTLGEAGKKMTDVGKNLSMKVTAPIVGLGAAVVKTGMDFEAAMSEVGAISGATGEDLAKLEALAKEMGATTKFSASEAADGLKFMAMAGWDTQKMLDGLPGVMNLAASSGESLGTVSDIVTDAMTAFGMEAARASEFADTLAAASSKSNTNVGLLGESFKHAAPVAGALGYEAKDAAIALGLMANAGIKGSQSGTTLRTMLTNLAKPTKAMQDAMDQYGISLTNTDGSMKSLDEVMLNLRESLGGLTEAEQAAAAATIFGKEAMSGALAIVNTSEEDYNKLSDAINNSTGAAQKMADEMQNNLAGRLTVFKSALEGVAIQLYDHLQPVLEKIVAVVQKVVDWFANLSPGMQQTIVVIAGVAAAIGPLLIVLGAMASGLGAIIGILPMLGTALAVLIGPVGIVVAAIAGLVAAGVALYKNWDEIKTYAEKTWNSIKDFFATTLETIKTVFSDSWNKLKDDIIQVFTAIKDFIVNTWNNIKDFYANLLNQIWNLVAAKFSDMKNAISTKMSEISQTIRNIWGQVKDFLSSINLFNIGKDIMRGFLDGISSMARAVMDKARDIANSVKDTISRALSIRSPSRVMMELGEYTGKGFEMGLEHTISSIKAAATGLAGAAVQPAAAGAGTASAAVAGVQGQTVQWSGGNIIIENMVIRNDEDIHKISRELASIQQRQMQARGFRR